MESDLIFGVIFTIFTYLLAGRLFGYTLYREVFIDFLISRNKLTDNIYGHSYNDPRKYEQNIRPKWFRNILRITSILIWPVSLSIAIIVVIFLLIYGSITSIIKFFTE